MRSSISIVTIILLNILIVFLSACGGGGSGSTPSPTPGTPPSAPTGVTATAGNTTVTITWNAVTGATSYNLYWSTTSGVTKATGTKIAGVIGPYTHNGLTNGTPYYYVVTAVNSYGESAESSQASATPQEPPLSAPTGVTATAGNARVTITWNAVTGATSYNLYWSTAPGVTKATGTKIAGVISPYTHTGLTNGTPYYYVLTAANSHGESVESPQASATPVYARLKWKYSTGIAIYYSAPAIGSDGTVYFGTGAPFAPSTPLRSLYAINPDGTLEWVYAVGITVHSPAIGADGTIYVQDASSSLYAFGQDATFKWKYTLSTFTDVGQMVPAIDSDGTIYMGADALYAINPDGTLKWRHVHSGVAGGVESIRNGPAIAPDGTIYVGANGGFGADLPNIGPSLWAVRRDGTLKWEYIFAYPSPNSNHVFSSPAVGPDGTVYIGVETPGDINLVYAINPDGTLKWRYEVSGGRTIRSSPTIGPDGTIYVGTKAGAAVNAELLALKPDGTLKWSYPIDQAGADIYCTPTVGADGMIYVGAETSKLYALNPDGTLAWSYDTTTGGINWTSPAIASDGTVYIGNNNGDFFALDSTSMGLANTTWPKFHHDNKNTGSN